MSALPQATEGDARSIDPDTAVDTHPSDDNTRTQPQAPRPIPEDALIILPVRNVVMFPSTIIPITIDRPRAQAAVQEAVRLERPLGVLLQSKPDIDEPGPDDVHWVGTSADVLRYLTGPDGSHQAVVRGLRRFRVTEFLTGQPFAVARVQFIDVPATGDAEIEGRGRALKQSALETLQLLPQAPPEMSA
ncbi:MAG: LON peptidase substrate-binding domain-containing protein, partial [Burkholderiaceae bacterium]